MIAGTADLDAAMTYEPYLSAVRAKPEAGKIIATTLDYPMVMDTFGCTPKFLAENPKAAKALADSYFEAVEMIQKEPKKASRSWARTSSRPARPSRPARSSCAGRTARQPEVLRRRARRLQQGSADLLLEAGIIKQMPDMAKLADTRFLK
jgi:NitT/TauT family transport system substrate-binding protein